MPIKLLIFDLDGTLIDSLSDLTDATNHMLDIFGRKHLTPADVRLMVGQGALNLVERAMPGASSLDVDRGMHAFLEYNEAHLADKTRPYSGVPETLDRLSARGLELAVISNKNVALCRKVLALLGIDGYFRAVLGADSLPFRKPSPEPLLKLLRDFELSAGEAAMVGDSINDIAAGQGAGVVTIGCTYGYGDGSELVGADYRIDSFDEIMGLPLFRND
jgi:phosphoglycolate phosphatase